MKFYIATKLENAAQAKDLARLLVEAGHEQTYDWAAHGSVQDQGDERIREVASNEAQGVASAEFVCVLLPGGRGTHVEMGMALALAKPTFVYVFDVNEERSGYVDRTGRICAFYLHPGVTVIGTKTESNPLLAFAWRVVNAVRPTQLSFRALDGK